MQQKRMIDEAVRHAIEETWAVLSGHGTPNPALFLVRLADLARSNAFLIGMQIGKSVGTIPTDLLLIGRTFGLLDGITKQLDPDMDTMQIVAHYA